ncbi:hypothetical protein GCM10019059_34760 [Camelimonas fluminis]|uniref:Helix-turn-helix domain-containing protein n=1 Tax=Camelimonas fluminis TaxID=1576911 RepID=A0ABV7UGF7_9HYPH|nr:helix-turn-helix domain-containing protein [Camelimonas fluminis]GHE72200.1 hypothetical protein GCM10019059_34760 [Camelimonas fluminis]
MTNESWPDLPAVLAEIAEVAGLEAALAIAEEKAGQEVFVCANLRPGNWLVRCVGMEKAELISRHMAGRGRVKVHIPIFGNGSYVSERKRRARVMAETLERGGSVNEIARRAGVTNRSAYRFKARHNGDPDQGSLF